MGIAHIYQQYQDYLTNNLTGHELLACDQYHCIAQFKQPELQTTIQINQFDAEILLSRNLSQGNGMYCSTTEKFSHNFALFFMLGGRNQVIFSDGRELKSEAGHVWLVGGDLHNAKEMKQTINGQLSSIHLDFSMAKLERWQEAGVLSDSIFTQRSDGQTQMQLLPKASASLMLLAQRLMQQPCHSDALAHLDLEAGTLDLTAHLLRLMLNNKQGRTQISQIDEAIDIIRTEFHQNLTIAVLARRVGLNECYLKRYFKEQTGETIANYIRALRLDCALEMLIDCKKSIKETMFYVGYRHVGHFNALFQKRFGYLPSEVVKSSV